MIGIYKIINPRGKVYIGQSVNIERRNIEYFKLKCKNQPKLYYSFQKYGVENHQFEIIEECTVEKLNEKEIYWGTHYGVLGDDGLNLRLGNANGLCSEKTKQKISKSQKGNKNHLGKFHSYKTKVLMSDTKKGIKYSKERDLKISKAHIKPIFQYDLQDNFIKEWPSIKEAKLHFNKSKDNPGIVYCCQGKQKTAYGFIWKYKY